MSSLRLRVEPGEIEAATLRVSGERHHYLTRVRRIAIGDEVELFDGAGRVRQARVTSLTGEMLELTALSPITRAHRAVVGLTSLVPLIKGERMDLAIAKLTELGVAAIAPVRCHRCVVSLAGERAIKRVERFERVAADAARQSGRADVPTIAPVRDLAEALAEVPAGATGLVFAPGAPQGLRDAVASNPTELVLLTGPEGGLTPEELEQAQTAGFASTRLGPLVLRAETASIVAAAAVLALVGELGG